MENQRLLILNDLLVFQGRVKLGRHTIRQHYKYNDSSNVKAVGKCTPKAGSIIDEDQFTIL
jgi:hypothetical protein